MADKAEPYPKRRRITTKSRRLTITEPEEKPSTLPASIAKKKNLPPEIDQKIADFLETICPLVLKIKTKFGSLILYDPPPPSSKLNAHTTGWDDGNLGTSIGCKLTNLLFAYKRQYVESLLKLMQKACQIIANEKKKKISQISLIIGELSQIHLTIFAEDKYEISDFSILFYPGTSQEKKEEKASRQKNINTSCHGKIKNSSVKFANNGIEYIADVLMRVLSETCKTNSSIKSYRFSVCFDNFDDLDNRDNRLELTATLCIKNPNQEEFGS
jgi:hypothetical protein